MCVLILHLEIYCPKGKHFCLSKSADENQDIWVWSKWINEQNSYVGNKTIRLYYLNCIFAQVMID